MPSARARASFGIGWTHQARDDPGDRGQEWCPEDACDAERAFWQGKPLCIGILGPELGEFDEIACRKGEKAYAQSDRGHSRRGAEDSIDLRFQA